MTKNLVIVESPAKARTIEHYLGPEYRVLASYGHVRDLPENPGKGKLGVDVDHDFAPEYVIVEDRRKQVDTIARAVRSADRVFLATDLDREGEAIAWHVAAAAGVPPEKAQRVTFSEITEPAIKAAFAHPRQVDEHLVDAQQARRIVDRLVGYTLSPLLWRKVRAGLSAGRVQSVAVRLVVEREREIRAFTAREYWTLEALLAARGGAVDAPPFPAELVTIDGAKAEVGDAAQAEAHRAALRDQVARVTDRSVTHRSRNPSPPFTTSTLQQEASRKLGFSPRRTMSVAQRLYEGIEAAGQVGLITYMRTDSVAMSGLAMGEARRVIKERYGEAYAMPRGRTFRNRTKGAQEAHEAIRPTSFARDPDSLAGKLGRDEMRLYRLVWQRALASQMASKEQETTTLDLEAGRYGLRASATHTLFDGFARVYTEGRDDEAVEEEGRLPELEVGATARVLEVTPTQHFTEPPPRYTEASLVKALEENGVGRPSTYASTIATIVDRGYVVVRERRLHPEPLGEVVTDLLVGHFGEFVDVGFTARMEADLDDVAQGKRAWVPLLRDFYFPFRERVEEKRRELRRHDFTTEPSDEVCSLGHPMVVRLGRYGRFLACSLYPEHRETRPLPGEAAPGEQPAPDGGGEVAQLPGVGETCPECGEGTLVAKRGRFGPFVGCSRYPDCRYIRKDTAPPPAQLAFEVECPQCGQGTLVARRARRTGSVFWGCSRYPKCRFTTSFEPVGALHDADAGPIARRPDGNRADGHSPEGRRPDGRLICLRCGATIEAPEPLAVGARVAGGPPDPGALARPRAARSGAPSARTGGATRRPRRAAPRRQRSGAPT